MTQISFVQNFLCRKYLDQIPNLLKLFYFIVKTPTQRQLNNNSTKVGFDMNTSLAALGALAHRLQRRTARKANEANLDPPNQKSEITSL